MAERKPANKTTSRPARGKASERFTAEERAAMREAARERRGEGPAQAQLGEGAVLAKIAEMAEPDRAMAERVHAVVMASAPDLVPRTWYGMPAYSKDGKVLCFFQSAQKFKTRYATFGFSDKANLDEGAMWPVAFALGKMTKAEEARIAELVRRAAN